MALPNLSFSGGASGAGTGDQTAYFGDIYKFSGTIPLIFSLVVIAVLVARMNK